MTKEYGFTWEEAGEPPCLIFPNGKVPGLEVGHYVPRAAGIPPPIPPQCRICRQNMRSRTSRGIQDHVSACRHLREQAAET